MTRELALALAAAALLAATPAAAAGRFALPGWLPAAAPQVADQPAAPPVNGAPQQAPENPDERIGFFEGDQETLIWRRGDVALSARAVQEHIPQMRNRNVTAVLGATGRGSWLVMRNLRGAQFYVFSNRSDGEVYFDAIAREINYGQGEQRTRLPLAGVRAVDNVLVAEYGSPQAGYRMLRRFAPDAERTQTVTALYQHGGGEARPLQNAWVLDPAGLADLYANPALQGAQAALTEARRTRISQFLGQPGQGGARRMVTLRVSPTGGVTLRLMEGDNAVDFLVIEGSAVEGTF